jgi:hypothetical protein
VNASEEQLAHWKAIENAKISQTYDCIGAGGQSGANKTSRFLALDFMMQAMNQAGASVSCWFQAARLLDDAISTHEAKAHYSHEQLVPIDLMLTSALAAWLISVKCEDADTTVVAPAGRKYRLGNLVHSATRVSEDSGGAPITEEMVSAMERSLFFASMKAVNLPTVDQWFSLVCRRFNVVTMGILGNRMILAATAWADQLAMAGILRAPWSAEARLPETATGIFGLVLIASRLVPMETLMPSSVDPEWWMANLSWSLTDIQANLSKLQEKVPSPVDAKVANAAVEFATGVPIKEVRENVLTATKLILACAWQQ